MPCGCKKNQAAQAPKPTNESIVKKSRPAANGNRGLRTEKRIIR